MVADSNTVLAADTAVAILAGGLSRRFGSPKALAPFRGGRLIDRMVALARQLSDAVFLVIGDQPGPPGLALPAYPDRKPGCGPLGGLDSALAHTPREWVALMPCDMPLLESTVYRVLAAYRQPGRPVLARSHTGLEPLVSLWPASLANRVENALQTGPLALHRWLPQWGAVEVDLPATLPDYQPRWFTNINRLRDLQALAKQEAQGKRG